MPNTFAKTTQKFRPAIRAYLGGSFDPVHSGHLQMAMYVYDRLAPIASEQQRALHVSLLPNARSPFKQRSTDPADRLAMLKLAIQDTPLQINELELWQPPPVYSIDSVRALRQRYPHDSLIFIMGMDSARSLDGWKDGLQLTDYVHLWIFDRDEHTNQLRKQQQKSQSLSITEEIAIPKLLTTYDIATLTSELPSALQPQVISSVTELLLINKPSVNRPPANEPLKDKIKGRIYIDTQSVATISSTEIRKQFYKRLPSFKYATNKSNHLTQWLNPRVYQYIIDHQLYSAL